MSNVIYAKIDSPVGPVWAAATERGICALGLGEGQPEALLDRLSRYVDKEPPRRDQKAMADALAQLGEYFACNRHEFDLALDVDGTPFQKAVWDEVAGIPYGATATYGDIARQIERPQAARAVGAALGANRVPILIPCHRVIGAGDKLVGYDAGVEIKAALLRLEGVLLS